MYEPAQLSLSRMLNLTSWRMPPGERRSQEHRLYLGAAVGRCAGAYVVREEESCLLLKEGTLPGETRDEAPRLTRAESGGGNSPIHIEPRG
jgi:hypothetical protein